MSKTMILSFCFGIVAGRGIYFQDPPLIIISAIGYIVIIADLISEVIK